MEDRIIHPSKRGTVNSVTPMLNPFFQTWRSHHSTGESVDEGLE